MGNQDLLAFITLIVINIIIRAPNMAEAAGDQVHATGSTQMARMSIIAVSN